MKKYPGVCENCGPTLLGYKEGRGFGGHKKKGKGFHPHKKGNYKCLSCQDTRYSKVNK